MVSRRRPQHVTAVVRSETSGQSMCPLPDDLDERRIDIRLPSACRPPFAAWLWPIPLGLGIGAMTLAGFCRSPGDPSGQWIGAGWGGLLGLVFAIVVRATCFRHKSIELDGSRDAGIAGRPHP